MRQLPAEHSDGELRMIAPDPDLMKRLAISLGICPYCKKNLSEPNKDGSRYCYSCHFWFNAEDELCQNQI